MSQMLPDEASITRLTRFEEWRINGYSVLQLNRPRQDLQSLLIDDAGETNINRDALLEQPGRELIANLETGLPPILPVDLGQLAKEAEMSEPGVGCHREAVVRSLALD